MSENELLNYINEKYENPYAPAYYLTKEILDPRNGAVILQSGLEVNADFTFAMPPFFTGYPFYGNITAGDTRVVPVDNDFGPELVTNISPGQSVEVSSTYFPENTLIDTVSRSADGDYFIVMDRAALQTEENVRFVARSFQRAILSGEQVMETISYNDYERTLNESKRKINILDPSLIEELMVEFQEKISYKEKTKYVPEAKGVGFDKSLSTFFHNHYKR